MIGPQPTNHEALHAEPIGRLLKPAGGGGGADRAERQGSGMGGTSGGHAGETEAV